MKNLVYGLFVCCLAILVGCSSNPPIVETHEHYAITPNVTPVAPNQSISPSYQSVAPTYSQPSTPVAPSTTVVASNRSGVPAWADEVIRETGEGAADMSRGNIGQARLLAQRAARLDAQRKLLERVLGLRLDSQTVVRDFVTQSDEIKAETSGYVRNSYEVGKNFDEREGTASVTMELKLYDVYMYMKTTRVYYE